MEEYAGRLQSPGMLFKHAGHAIFQTVPCPMVSPHPHRYSGPGVICASTHAGACRLSLYSDVQAQDCAAIVTACNYAVAGFILPVFNIAESCVAKVGTLSGIDAGKPVK